MTRSIVMPPEIRRACDAGALFVLNHSGGKDSQAMTVLLRELVPAGQLIVVHAHLREVDWPDAEDHARATAAGLEFHRVEAGKSFFEMVDRRQMWPSAQYRQCTSDLKRDPIHTWLRRLCRERGIGLVVDCLGLRAEESTDRARKPAVQLDGRVSIRTRRVLQWLPIQEFAAIAAAGPHPHWAYAAGMSRLSCVFCIFSSKADLCIAARLRPRLYRRYVETERRLDFTLQNGRTLEEATGIPVAGGVAA